MPVSARDATRLRTGQRDIAVHPLNSCGGGADLLPPALAIARDWHTANSRSARSVLPVFGNTSPRVVNVGFGLVRNLRHRRRPLDRIELTSAAGLSAVGLQD